MSSHNKALIFFFIVVVTGITVPILIPAIIIALLLTHWFTTSYVPAKSEPLPPILFDSEITEYYAFLETKKQYLNSPEWEIKRVQRYIIADGKCESCGCTLNNYQVHHLTDYTLIPNEPISSLRALCTSCHEFQHMAYGFPTTMQEYRDWNKELI